MAEAEADTAGAGSFSPELDAVLRGILADKLAAATGGVDLQRIAHGFSCAGCLQPIGVRSPVFMTHDLTYCRPECRQLALREAYEEMSVSCSSCGPAPPKRERPLDVAPRSGKGVMRLIGEAVFATLQQRIVSGVWNTTSSHNLPDSYGKYRPDSLCATHCVDTYSVAFSASSEELTSELAY